MRSTAPAFTDSKVSKSEMELKHTVGQKKHVELSLYQATKFIQNNRETERAEGHRFHDQPVHQHFSSQCPEQLIHPTLSLTIQGSHHSFLHVNKVDKA
jgi:hypothetical protein